MFAGQQGYTKTIKLGLIKFMDIQFECTSSHFLKKYKTGFLRVSVMVRLMSHDK